MKTYIELKFRQDGGPELNTAAYEDRILVSQVFQRHWDPDQNCEVEGARVEMSMSPEDARELAENLLKAADHADEMGSSKSGRRY